MFKTAIELFFGKYAVYLAGFFAMLAIGFGSGWYISNVRYEAELSRREKTEVQLSVSNASYNSIKSQFQALTKTLEENQRLALVNQENMRLGLEAAVASGNRRELMEKELLNRTPETQCVTPKDLSDAWSSL